MSFDDPPYDHIVCRPLDKFPVDQAVYIGIEPPELAATYSVENFKQLGPAKLETVQKKLNHPVKITNCVEEIQLDRQEIEKIIESYATLDVNTTNIWGAKFQNLQFPQAGAIVVEKNNS